MGPLLHNWALPGQASITSRGLRFGLVAFTSTSHGVRSHLVGGLY
jgi:hypothetical protein